MIEIGREAQHDGKPAWADDQRWNKAGEIIQGLVLPPYGGDGQSKGRVQAHKEGT